MVIYFAVNTRAWGLFHRLICKHFDWGEARGISVALDRDM